MTAQAAESIYYEGKNRALFTCPLEDYFKLAKVSSLSSINCTALWRGYLGSWEINQERLYLMALESISEPLKLKDIFPDFSNRVFAHWYTGVLRIPDGKLLRYHHMGFSSEYEREIFIHIKRGVVSKVTTINDRDGD
jgi:hypothetical protein